MASIKTEIRISKEELEQIIKEKFGQDGVIDFIIRERSRMAGDVLITTNYFDGVMITTQKTT
jgi:hypothetical protein